MRKDKTEYHIQFFNIYRLNIEDQRNTKLQFLAKIHNYFV